MKSGEFHDETGQMWEIWHQPGEDRDAPRRWHADLATGPHAGRGIRLGPCETLDELHEAVSSWVTHQLEIDAEMSS